MCKTAATHTLLAAGLVLWLQACADGGDAPGLAVQDFYRHLNEGDYAGAMAMYTDDALRTLEDAGPEDRTDFALWAEAETKHSSIARVKLLASRAETDRAHVEYEIHYADGSSAHRTVELTLEGDHWRLGFVG